MWLGIFARTFDRPDLGSTLDAVAAYGFDLIHIGMLSAGLDAMPAAIPGEKVDEVRNETNARGIEIASLSGTFNMIHPDPAVVRDGLDRLEVLAASAHGIGTNLITLCTGSRDPENMWRKHPGNDLPDAWDALIESMTTALAIADRHDVLLGIETEPGNVVNSMQKCRKLLDHFGSPRIKVVFDPANLVSTDLSRDPARLLDDAFSLLGADVIAGHGKDCASNGDVVPAGKGIVPWDLVLRLLGETPVVLHGLAEADVANAVEHLREKASTAT